jgi:hypothetical protein
MKSSINTVLSHTPASVPARVSFVLVRDKNPKAKESIFLMHGEAALLQRIVYEDMITSSSIALDTPSS